MYDIFLGKSLVFIDSIQFINSSLDKLVKNLSDEDFNYLVGKFGSKLIRSTEQLFLEKSFQMDIFCIISTYTFSSDFSKNTFSTIILAQQYSSLH